MRGAGQGVLTRADFEFLLAGVRLARIIHDGSLRNRAVAWRDERVELRRPEAYLKQYVEGLSGEPARLHAAETACRLVRAANSRLQQKRS